MRQVPIWLRKYVPQCVSFNSFLEASGSWRCKDYVAVNSELQRNKIRSACLQWKVECMEARSCCKLPTIAISLTYVVKNGTVMVNISLNIYVRTRNLTLLMLKCQSSVHMHATHLVSAFLCQCYVFTGCFQGNGHNPQCEIN